MITAFIVFTRFKATNIYIPVEQAEHIFGVKVDKANGEYFYHRTSSYAEHIIFCTAFIGWFFFTIMAGIGFVALPWDIFVDY